MSEHKNWDTSYEFRAITLLAVGFGLVGLDRFIINPLFPVIAEDLGLGYQDLGLISGVLAFTWGFAALFAGKITDRVGAKKVLIISVILFSILVATSGLATGLISLLVIRALMGFAEGGFVPASIVATVQAAKPTRVGMAVGIQQMAAPFVGLGLGPLVAVGLLLLLPSWEWVFATVALPGFLVAYLMYRVLKDRPMEATVSAAPTQGGYLDALKIRNVLVAAIGIIFFLSSLHPLGAFMPNYLVDYKGIALEQMGIIMSGLGIGGVLGMIIIPAISDRIGMKITIACAMLLTLLAALAIVALNPGTLLMIACLFSISAGASGAVAITIGPFVSASVPPAIAATATGVVVGIGEMIGGAIAPALTGGLAENMGIHVIPYVSLISATLGVLVVLIGMKEPQRLEQARSP
ncbi:MAG: MFS transporter [Pseudomonadota bacterium]